MILQNITYENFRNHRFLTFEPEDGINLIYGPNGSGKTSILDGIHYCALTKGLVSANDSDSLSFSSDYFLLNSIFLSEAKSATTVKVFYNSEREKQITVNNTDLKPFSRHIGRIPCITFSPPEIAIVNGAPGERRRFIDNAISQTNILYLDNLIAYRRVLLQRNALLSQLNASQSIDQSMLSLWTDSLSRLSALIVLDRIQFVARFAEFFSKLYPQLSINENPGITYRSSLGKIAENTSFNVLYERFCAKYEETKKQDIFRTQTSTGPHRDDLIFLINDREIKKYASQGQLRTFLISLKLSQYRFLHEKQGEKPICLLDDIFSELDASRITEICRILETCGQTIITSAQHTIESNVRLFSVESLMKK